MRRLGLQRGVDRQPPQPPVRDRRRQAGQRPGDPRIAAGEELPALLRRRRGVQELPRARDVAVPGALALGGVEDVLLVERVEREVGRVVDAGAALEPQRQVLVDRAVQQDAAGFGHLVAVDVGRLLQQAVGPQVAGVGRRAQPAVLRAVALAGLREPVVQHGQVLAAGDGPEEGVAHRLALVGGAAVGGQQEAGGPVVVLDRVVEDRQVEDRHVLDPHHGVAEHGVVADVDRGRAGHQLPPRRRLHAGGEAALADPVAILAGLLHGLAVEVDVGLEGAEHALVGLLAQRGQPRGGVERAGAGPGVERRALGRDARRGRFVDDGARRLEPILGGVQVDDVGVELLSRRPLRSRARPAR